MHPVSTLDSPTRRSREINWGDRTRLTGRESKTLAWVSIENACPMVLYATALIRGAGSENVAVVADVEWGHGGASVEQSYPIVHRLRVPLAASMVKVSGRLLDASGSPPPPTVVAEVSVVIAPGMDGQTIRNTEWTQDGGAEGTLSSLPARLLNVEGYNAGSIDTWIMIFDGLPTTGEVPTIACPVRVDRSFAIRRPDSQAFRNAVTWAASSSPLVLTKAPSAILRVDAEFLL
ncbi:MAG TPA: hypothetical protein VF407_15875 [Polyangiaceae bacterium]